ncbi:hypothetical protein B7486_26390 [cyanobacterium TDX16]|nr:hypothetical protein B7486_26390 [cyanobacterium TDX16]
MPAKASGLKGRFYVIIKPNEKRKTKIEYGDFSILNTGGFTSSMSDLNRGIMKFDGADSPKVVIISTVLLLGAIAALIFWALRVAYAV